MTIATSITEKLNTPNNNNSSSGNGRRLQQHPSHEALRVAIAATPVATTNTGRIVAPVQGRAPFQPSSWVSKVVLLRHWQQHQGSHSGAHHLVVVEVGGVVVVFAVRVRAHLHLPASLLEECTSIAEPHPTRPRPLLMS